MIFSKKNMESSHGSGLLDTTAKSQRQVVFRLNYCFCCAWSQWVILRIFGLRGLLQFLRNTLPSTFLPSGGDTVVLVGNQRLVPA